MNGWRTILVENPSVLRLKDGHLYIEQEKESHFVPLEQIKMVYICNLRTSVTSALIDALQRNHISLIYCDEKHNPCCEMTSMHSNIFSAGRLFEQTKWKNKNKGRIWRSIIENKIGCQISALKFCRELSDPILEHYLDTVEDNDRTNREGLAAKAYFLRMFGSNFARHSDDQVNAALNYGYAILLSSINRLVTIHGYQSELGICHVSQCNPYNLSCDLMEPFRPVIDTIVYENRAREFDKKYKAILIESGERKIRYDGQRTTLANALADYVPDTLSKMHVKQDSFITKKVSVII